MVEAIVGGVIGAGQIAADIGTNIANLNYQKEYNRTIWAREDNAQQRAVADLRAAGLSPTLAAGKPAQVGGSSAAPQLTKTDALGTQLALMRGLADIDKTREETAAIKLQAEGQDLNNQLSSGTLATKIQQAELAVHQQRETVQAIIEQVNNHTLPQKQFEEARARLTQNQANMAVWQAASARVQAEYDIDTQEAKIVAALALTRGNLVELESKIHNLSVATATGAPVGQQWSGNIMANVGSAIRGLMSGSLNRQGRDIHGVLDELVPRGPKKQ